MPAISCRYATTTMWWESFRRVVFELMNPEASTPCYKTIGDRRCASVKFGWVPAHCDWGKNTSNSGWSLNSRFLAMTHANTCPGKLQFRKPLQKYRNFLMSVQFCACGCLYQHRWQWISMERLIYWLDTSSNLYCYTISCYLSNAIPLGLRVSCCYFFKALTQDMTWPYHGTWR